ncbi:MULTISPECIES: SDR family NAD(P)-dependent oxidoreductase [unclassified Rhodosalinus]|uniref:SDR family NAD(P)-dependent oxidoreductase n=1 Tax=unclassified Rhodosalinus TaxID=2630183 RepID=UPI003525FA0E
MIPSNALVIGASGGIGAAVAAELDRRGANVTSLSRSADGFDVTDEASVEAGLSRLEGPFDLIFVATGALELDGHGPEKSLRHLEPRAMIDQFSLNCVGPAIVLKHAVGLMPREGRSVFAALSARVGSIGDNRMGGWYSYRVAKAALNQMLHGAAVEIARTRPEAVIAALHPGTVETALTAKYAGGHPTVTPERAAERLAEVVERLQPRHSGGFYDYAFEEIPW